MRFNSWRVPCASAAGQEALGGSPEWEFAGATFMLASASSANPINRRQTPAALPLLLLFAAEFQRFAPESVVDLADSTHALPVVSRFAEVASWECAGADGNCALQQATPDLRRFAKRILHLLLTSIAILLLWPLMLVIAVAVKLESLGPAIYPSLRVGKRGMLVVCHKFRKMIPGANRLRNNLLQLIRKYSLDELPGSWNVLKGDMSLVGPRPHPLENVAQYGPGHEKRLEVTPGITGLWQVTARENPSFETCMLLDLGYIRDWSLWLDCKILLRTIRVVSAGEGL